MENKVDFKVDENLKHIAFIMDGNGRWAKARGMNRPEGHKEGVKIFEKMGFTCLDFGLEAVTFYAFSTENWKRPQEEVDAIMQLFREYLREAEERQAENEEKGIKLCFLGDRKGIPEDILSLMDQIENGTQYETKVILNLAINYGGRHEITEGVKTIAKKVKNGEISIDDITEDMISDSLYTAGSPDPDLIIRPSGEYRLSNFLTWQSAYSEFWFSDVLWPDFTEENLIEALREFEKRNRRFGGV